MGIGIPYLLPLTLSIDVATLGYKHVKDNFKKRKIKETGKIYQAFKKIPKTVESKIGKTASILELPESTLLSTTFTDVYRHGGALYESVGVPLHELGEYMIGGSHGSFLPEVRSGLLALMGITAAVGYAKTSKKPVSKKVYRHYDRHSSYQTQRPKDVTVVVSAHKQKNSIEESIRNIFEQNYPIKNLYISDSNLDNTKDVIDKLKEEFPNVHYWSKEGITSKGEKINSLIKDTEVNLGYYTYLTDADITLHPNTIEKLVGGFKEDNIAAVTSYGYVTPPDNYLAKCFHYGKEWANRLGKFRKTAQQQRRATHVVCGASYMVKSDVLKKIEIPTDTVTEDTAFTWRLNEEGYKVGFVPDAVVSSEDVGNLKAQLKQSYRWYRGTWQNLYKHKNMFGRKSKAKSLAYSTVLPGFAESLLYTGAVVSLPITAYLAPDYAKYFLIGDTVLSFATPLIAPPLSGESKDIPKELLHTLKHYHQITSYKAMSSALWLGAGLKTGYDILTGKSKKWTNNWE